MNQESCSFKEGAHSGTVKNRFQILPESLHLATGFDRSVESIRSLVSVNLCEAHWEECKNRVLADDENILPLFRADSQRRVSYFTEDDRRASSLGELENERQELIRRSFEEDPRNRPTRRQIYGKDESLDDIFDRDLVERFLARHTLEKISPEPCGKTEALKYELVDELADRGFSADRIYERMADIEATHSSLTFYFQVWWLTEDSESVSPADRIAPIRREMENPVWPRSLPSDSYYAPDSEFPGESQLRHFADDRGGIPVQAVKWKEDERWYIFYRQPSEYGEYITIENASWVPIRVFKKFTPLPTLDDLPQLLEEQVSIDSAIESNLKEFYSDLPSSKRLIGRYRRFRSSRL